MCWTNWNICRRFHWNKLRHFASHKFMSRQHFHFLACKLEREKSAMNLTHSQVGWLFVNGQLHAIGSRVFNEPIDSWYYIMASVNNLPFVTYRLYIMRVVTAQNKQTLDRNVIFCVCVCLCGIKWVCIRIGTSMSTCATK